MFHVRFAFFSLLVIIFTFMATVGAEAPYDGQELSSGYITVIDDNGSVILQTGLAVRPGDQYISENNCLYEITAVEGYTAQGKYIRDEKDIAYQPIARPTQAPPNGETVPVAIYHTHTDESYIPTDGTATAPGNGSIILVGNTFAQRLAELGYQPIHDKTLHEPHDANAYQRSRRTFMKLLAQQPAALFDIHRDSAPLSAYKATINGEDVSKILLVVGRQNQNHRTTLNYAKTIKSAADAKYSGLIRGIFIAHGNYNQDLSPRAMLIEIGTQYNTLEAAQRSVALFADVIPAFLSPGRTNPPENTGTVSSAETSTPSEPNKNYAYDLLLLLGIVVIITLGYLYLSAGSWQEVKRKMEKFRKFEFTNFLGPKKKKDD